MPPDSHDLSAAIAAHRAGRLDDAMRLYRRLLDVEPRNASAMHLLGLARFQCGDPAAALELMTGAMALDDSNPDHHNNLGAVFRELGRQGEAEASYLHALRLAPEHFDAHNNLGALRARQRRFREAIGSLEHALALAPEHAQARNNLGNVYHNLGRLDDAIACFRAVLAARPEDAGAYSNLGLSLHARGEYQAAEDSFRRALALQPEFADAHLNLGLLLLLQGDFASGWAEYEWRQRVVGFEGSPRAKGPRRWNGEPLDGERILLHAEQGFGDTLQFVRYLPLVAARGGRVVLEVPAELKRIMAASVDSESVLCPGDPVPEIGWHCPLPSLPGAFASDAASIPRSVPYLRADPAGVARWRASMDLQRFNVGLVWAGRAEHGRDRVRSLPLAALAPLADVPGVTWHALQKGPGAEQLAHAPPALRLIDHDRELTDFAETAALVCALDLVICVDTSVAHLAGGLGKPVWILLSHVPDFRWLLGRDDSPWYPSARLFRQPSFGAWPPVIEAVRAQLRTLVGAGI